MSQGLNRVTLFGNLCAEVEARTTSGGQSVLKLRMATNESYLDRNRARQERVEYHSVTVWGKRGEALSRILHKGDRILVEGALRTSSYEKDGQKRYSTEVVASNIILGGSSGGGQRGERQEQEQPAQTGGGGYSDADYGPSPDDDFPF